MTWLRSRPARVVVASTSIGAFLFFDLAIVACSPPSFFDDDEATYVFRLDADETSDAMHVSAVATADAPIVALDGAFSGELQVCRTDGLPLGDRAGRVTLLVDAPSTQVESIPTTGPDACATSRFRLDDESYQLRSVHESALGLTVAIGRDPVDAGMPELELTITLDAVARGGFDDPPRGWSFHLVEDD